jgi:hypothetical protein
MLPMLRHSEAVPAAVCAPQLCSSQSTQTLEFLLCCILFWHAASSGRVYAAGVCNLKPGVLLCAAAGWCVLAGSKSQDDAAEDPLTAVKEGLTPNYQLYW